MLKDEFCTLEGSRCVILRGRGGACLTCGGARPTLSCNAHNLLLRNESISCAQQKLPCTGKENPLLVGRCKVDSVNPPRIHRKLIDNTYLQTTTYGARGVKTFKQHRNAASLWSYLIWTYRKNCNYSGPSRLRGNVWTFGLRYFLTRIVTTQVVAECESMYRALL